jgi:hypothetical protein
MAQDTQKPIAVFDFAPSVIGNRSRHTFIDHFSTLGYFVCAFRKTIWITLAP